MSQKIHSLTIPGLKNKSGLEKIKIIDLRLSNVIFNYNVASEIHELSSALSLSYFISLFHRY